MLYPMVSVVIPTVNRRDEVLVAVRCAVEQTYPADRLEIIVVDDGGDDDTGAALTRAFGDRITYAWKPNGGVASARNHGLSIARGELLALLDSDDEWTPTKIERQVERFLHSPRLGMVLTNVERMGRDRVTVGTWDRRDQLPRDGWVLSYVLRHPSLVPSSAMFTREVLEATGGFDEALVTAEDLDFHLRVAQRWPIALVDAPLTRVMRGHAGLSMLARSYRDHLFVVERFVRDHGAMVGAELCDLALLEACTRNALGLAWDGNLLGAVRYGLKGASRVRSVTDAARFAALSAGVARGFVGAARHRIARASVT